MQLAVSSRSFEPDLTAGRLQLWDLPGEARLLGVTHVELYDAHLRPARPPFLGGLRRYLNPPSPAPPDRAYDFKQLNRIDKALDHYDVKLAAWACDCGLGKPDELPRARAYVRLALDTARRLGAQVLRITLDHDAVRRDVGPTISALEALVVDAELAGVRLAVENDRPSASVERILGIVRGVNSAWLGACLNFAHFDPRSPAGLFERLAERTVHVHVEGGAGRGLDTLYSAYLGVLRTLRYEGVIAAEYVGEGDPRAGISRMLDEIRRVWR